MATQMFQSEKVFEKSILSTSKPLLFFSFHFFFSFITVLFFCLQIVLLILLANILVD